MPLEATLRLAPIRTISAAETQPVVALEAGRDVQLERRRPQPATSLGWPPALPQDLRREGGLA